MQMSGILIEMVYSTAYLRLYKDCTLLKDQQRSLSQFPGLFPFPHSNESVRTLAEALSYRITVMASDHLSKITPLTP